MEFTTSGVDKHWIIYGLTIGVCIPVELSEVFDHSE